MKTASLFVSTVLAWLWTAPPAVGAEAPLAPGNLRCEYAVNPLGMDVREPRFSWEVRDPRRGAVQAAYQVLVATDVAALAEERADAWDSGKVESDQSIHVVYAGQPIESGKRYWWKVRTWDRGGNASPYAAPAFWETGLLAPADWAARWITIGDEARPAPSASTAPPPDPPLSRWIWRKACPAPVLEDSFYHGETHDARLEMPGWDQAGFDASEWHSTLVLGDSVERLAAQQGPPIRVTAELTGLPQRPRDDALVYRVLHSDAPTNGAFRCSNDLINRFWKCIVWGQRSNLHSVPTDCPQRDERLGWTGDAQVFAGTACWNMDMAGFFSKWMWDIILGSGNGVVMGGGPGWDDVTVILPWTLYCFYADTRIVGQSYPRMAAYVDARLRAAPNGLFEKEGYGDWVAVAGSPKKPIGAAYHGYSTRLLSLMAEAIGKTDDARKYAEAATRIAEAFNNAYFDKDRNSYPGSTQTALVLPLAFGLAPADRRSKVLDHLAGDIVGRGYHLTTGFLGTPYLLPVLSDGGRHEVAFRLAAQNTYPSWGYMVEQGATTVWELWNSDKAGPGMNSRNHFALGSVGSWYFQSLAGIHYDPRMPGFKRIAVRPLPIEGLTDAEATYHSMFGPIRSAWRIEGSRFRLDLLIPPNTTGALSLPADRDRPVTESDQPIEKADGVRFLGWNETPYGMTADCELGSGRYRFASTLPAGR